MKKGKEDKQDKGDFAFSGKADWYYQRVYELDVIIEGSWDGAGLGIQVAEEQYEGIINTDDDW
jgi:hypothetical protein